MTASRPPMRRRPLRATCARCEKQFRPAQLGAKYCSGACRVAAHRAKAAAEKAFTKQTEIETLRQCQWDQYWEIVLKYYEDQAATPSIRNIRNLAYKLDQVFSLIFYETADGKVLAIETDPGALDKAGNNIGTLTPICAYTTCARRTF